METVKRQQASERQFEALERMTAVSQMSNIVAHELRQPLATVTNFAMGVRRRIANGTLTADSLEFALGRILAENERASDIVEHVRDYARKRRRQITPVDLTQMSAKVVSSITIQSKERSTVWQELSQEKQTALSMTERAIG